MVDIQIVDASTVITEEEVLKVIPALQTQIDRDFLPFWGLGARLVPARVEDPVPPGTWRVVVLDDSDQANALGYHNTTPAGDPQGKVFARTEMLHGLNWTVTLSHELLEILADPSCNYYVMRGFSRFPTLYATEVCDPVEADRDAYQIGVKDEDDKVDYLVAVSNFVTPAYFQELGDAPYDFMGQLTKPFEIRPGGYQLIFRYLLGWQNLYAAHQNDADTRHGSMSERRALRKSHRTMHRTGSS